MYLPDGVRRENSMKSLHLPACSCLLLVLAVSAPASELPCGDNTDDPVRRETVPPLLTLYLPIPLGVPDIDEQSTGVFVPDHYHVGATIDLVLFLRGYDIKRPKTATSVSEYWNSPQHPVLKSFQFREEINRS